MADELHTDFVDVSNVVDDIDDGTPTKFQARTSPLSIAPLKERFVAACIDTYGVILFYFVFAAFYRGIALGTAHGPIPVWGLHGLLLHALFLLLVLVGYVLFEGVLFVTPGKWMCRLRIRHINGGVPGFRSILFRNLMRPLDLLLLPLFFGIVLIEKMSSHQRFGDLVASTVVIQLTQDSRPVIHREGFASASGRCGAFFFDALLLSLFAYGYALLFTPEAPLTSQFLFLCIPFVFISFFLLPPLFTQTSPGKWIFGYSIAHEDGSRASFASNVVRILFLFIDIIPLSLLCILISPRRQRSGDTAAATVVVVKKRDLKGFIGFLLMVALAGSMMLTGQKNRDSFLSPGFHVNFLPALDFSREHARLRQREQQVLSVMRIENVTFHEGSPNSPPRPSANFYPGENLFLVFQVDGYALEGKEIWLKEDLTIRSPDGALALKREEIIDFHQTVEKAEAIEFSNKVALPKTAKPGRYTATIAIRDQLSKRKLTQQRFFYVIGLNE